MVASERCVFRGSLSHFVLTVDLNAFVYRLDASFGWCYLGPVCYCPYVILFVLLMWLNWGTESNNHGRSANMSAPDTFREQY